MSGASLCYNALGDDQVKKYGLNDLQDLIVIGAGPAALSILHHAKEQGLSAVAIDKGPVCSALLKHPTYMRWFSTADKLELAGFPLLINEKNPTRREYLQYCRAVVNFLNLKIVTYHEVTAITPTENHFDIHANDIYGRPYTWHTRNVAMATGFFDSPRPLGVPGEDLPKVTHRYSEAHCYADHNILIIGGGSSAAEVALELNRAGASVTIAMRGNEFETKYWIKPDIENRIKEGAIVCHRRVKVTEIRMDDVLLEDESGKKIIVENDFILSMTGYEPDTTLLKSTGAQVDPDSNKPLLDENYQTTAPGVYVAGTLCAGRDSNVVFVENSREHGPAIVNHIRATTPKKVSP